MTSEDASFLRAIRQRDRTAWATLYEQHVREIYAFISHLVRANRPLAEELHQEVWLSAIDSIDRFDPRRGTLRRWILGIARRQVALQFRRASRAVPAPAASAEGSCEPVDDAFLPEDHIEQAERAALVHAAMTSIAVERRELLQAKYIDGLSVRQLAKRSGRTEKSVESLLARARTELRALLGEMM